MSYTSLFYHIVFSTKDRQALLGDVGRACDYIGGVARQLKSQLLVGGGTADHVHLAAIVSPTVAVSEFVQKLKANSSRWIHETYPELRAFAWQDGYAAFSVSPSVLATVKGYIQGQARHHKKMTFQEELVALLKKHGVEYDERYIWA